MDPYAATDLLLAAAPAAPGARRLLAVWAAGAGARPHARVLLAGEGLAWARDDALRDVAADLDVAVCSRNARDVGWRLADAPPGIRWSSVATWMAETAPGTTLWVALP